MRGLFAAMCAGLLALPVCAQQSGGPLSQGVVQSPVLVIEFERVFAQSQFGLKWAADLEAEGVAIAAENRKIEAELVEEEGQLTQQRETMSTEAFRALADAFDEKVQLLRAEQDAKARALGARSEEAQRAFLELAQPVLFVLMREAGAAVILERRSVFVSDTAIDITDLAVERINAAIGDTPPEQP